MVYSVPETYGGKSAAVIRFPVMPDDVYGIDIFRARRYDELQELKAARWITWTDSQTP